MEEVNDETTTEGKGALGNKGNAKENVRRGKESNSKKNRSRGKESKIEENEKRGKESKLMENERRRKESKLMENESRGKEGSFGFIGNFLSDLVRGVGGSRDIFANFTLILEKL